MDEKQTQSQLNSAPRNKQGKREPSHLQRFPNRASSHTTISDKPHRRSLLRGLCSGALLAALPLTTNNTALAFSTSGRKLVSPLADDAVRFSSTGIQTPRKVRVALDVTGTVHLQPGQEETTRLPLRVQGRMNYEEKGLAGDSPSLQVIRYYSQAEADIRVGQGQTLDKLPANANYFVVSSNTDPQSSKLNFHRLDGSLTSQQSELLEVPFETAVLEHLLPTDEETKSIGDSWSPKNESLASLLNLDSVTRQDVTCEFLRKRNDDAEIHLKGEVQGGIDGVATAITINGTLTYSTSQQAFRKVQLTLRESRSIGRARPGFEVTAKIEVQLSPVAQSAHLGADQLAQWDLAPQREAEPLTFKSTLAGFELLMDRRWRVISDQRDVTVFRMIDQGDLVAQCNVSRLQNISQGKQVTLDEFRKDVSKAVAKEAGQVLEADEFTGSGAAKVLRVIASGVVSEVSMQWHYYHLTDNAGRRAAMIVSIESEFYERFAESDRLLIETLELSDVDTSDSSSATSAAQRTNSNQDR